MMQFSQVHSMNIQKLDFWSNFFIIQKNSLTAMIIAITKFLKIFNGFS